MFLRILCLTNKVETKRECPPECLNVPAQREATILDSLVASPAAQRGGRGLLSPSAAKSLSRGFRLETAYGLATHQPVMSPEWAAYGMHAV